MASLWKHPESKYWVACYTDRDGKQVKRSTKQTKRKEALTIALELERVEQQARRGTVTTLQIQKVLNGPGRKDYGRYDHYTFRGEVFQGLACGYQGEELRSNRRALPPHR